MSKEPSPEQIKHNLSLWKWFPLGQVDAIWHLVEHLHAQVGEKYLPEVEAVLVALQELDDKIRVDNYSLSKRRVKGSNGVLRRRKTKNSG
jgi:hypothetical protein